MSRCPPCCCSGCRDEIRLERIAQKADAKRRDACSIGPMPEINHDSKEDSISDTVNLEDDVKYENNQMKGTQGTEVKLQRTCRDRDSRMSQTQHVQYRVQDLASTYVLRPHLLNQCPRICQKSGHKIGGSEFCLGKYIVTRGQGERQERRERLEKIEETQREDMKGGESMSIYKLKNY